MEQTGDKSDAKSALDSTAISVMCWNIANANPDEEHMPMGDRFPSILAKVRKCEPDVLCLLEAGRPSKGRSFTSYAEEIERETDLTYIGIFYALPSTPQKQYPFGKALFCNRHRVEVQPVALPIEADEFEWPLKNSVIQKRDISRSGNDILIVRIQPTGRTDIHFKVGFVHLPMPREKRLRSVQWFSTYAVRSLVNVLMGDFNTFPNDAGPAMEKILSTQYDELLPSDTKITFRGFPHDVIRLPVTVPINPESIVVYKDSDDKHQGVRFNSWLDHVYLRKKKAIRDYYHGEKRNRKPSISFRAHVENCERDEHVASDHDPCILTALY